MTKSDWVEVTYDCDYFKLVDTEFENGRCSDSATWVKNGVGRLCQAHYEAYIAEENNNG